MDVRIRLLGSPSIEVDGRPAAIRGQKPWVVLARILLAERPVERRRLAWDVFPEAEDPLGALRWSLAELRRAVGVKDAFTGDPVEARLPEGARVDVVDVEGTAIDEIANCGLLDGVDPRCSPGLESWLLVERERTAAEIDGLLRRCILDAQAIGDHGRALRLAQMATERRPYDEGGHILLVRALVDAGRSAAARAHVERTTELFVEGLGIPPSDALVQAARSGPLAPTPAVSAEAATRALLDAGRAAVAVGAVDAGIECLRGAVARADSAGLHLKAEALTELGGSLVHAVRGSDEEGAALLACAAELASECGDGPLAGRALVELAYIDALVGRRPSAIAYLERARDLVEGDPAGRAWHEAVGAFNAADWGRLRAGLDGFERAADLARSADLPRVVAWALGLGARAHLLAGSVVEGRRWSEEALEASDRDGWLSFRPWPLAVLGEARLIDGDDPDEVRGDVEASFALACQLRDPCWEGATARSLALVDMATGREEDAWSWIRDARSRAGRTTDAYAGVSASILATEAEVADRRGDHAAHDAAARDLLEFAARTHQDVFVRLALARLGVADR